MAAGHQTRPEVFVQPYFLLCTQLNTRTLYLRPSTYTAHTYPIRPAQCSTGPRTQFLTFVVCRVVRARGPSRPRVVATPPPPRPQSQLSINYHHRPSTTAHVRCLWLPIRERAPCALCAVRRLSQSGCLQLRGSLRTAPRGERETPAGASHRARTGLRGSLHGGRAGSA
jgi:hypothetical protein